MCAQVLEFTKTQTRRTLEQAVDIFLLDRKSTGRGIADDTDRTYRARLGAFVSWALGRELRHIDEVDADAVDAFFVHLRDEKKNHAGEPLGDNTIRDYFLSLRAFFSALQRDPFPGSVAFQSQTEALAGAIAAPQGCLSTAPNTPAYPCLSPPLPVQTGSLSSTPGVKYAFFDNPWEAKTIYVLRAAGEAGMWAALDEVAFLTNGAQQALLLSATYQQQVVRVISGAIRSYLRAP